jgi:hypothetical protein
MSVLPFPLFSDLFYHSILLSFFKEHKKFWKELVYCPYISNLFEVFEPNLMEINLSEVTLT